MAFTEALKAFAQVITSYEWDYNIKELEQLEEDELVSLETLLAPSDRFMKFGRLNLQINLRMLEIPSNKQSLTTSLSWSNENKIGSGSTFSYEL